MAGTKVRYTKGAPRSFKLAWGSPIEWMLSVAAEEQIIVKEIVVHWHKELYGRKCPLGEADAETKSIMLCTHVYDKDTMLHELAHLGSIGVHGTNWSERFIGMINKYMSDRERDIALFMAGRDYRNVAKLIGGKK